MITASGRIVHLFLLCAALAGCDAQGMPPARSPVSEGPAPSPLPVSRPVAGELEEACRGDTELPVLSPGWKLAWQHVFEHWIARPPIVDGAQVFILERANPFLPETNFRDQIWALNPETGAVLWTFGDTDVPTYIRDIEWSQPYLALGPIESIPGPGEPMHIVVLDRAAGHIVFDGRLRATIFVVSDDALYYRDLVRAYNRVDLPSGERRWMSPTQIYSEMVVINADLYAIDARQIRRVDTQDGRILATSEPGRVNEPSDASVTSPPPNTARLVRYVTGVALFDFQRFTTRWIKPGLFYWANSSFTENSADLTSDSRYVFDQQGNLIRLDWDTGETVWSAPSPGVEPASGAVAAEGVVYALYADGTLSAFAEADGTPMGVVTKVPLWYWKAIGKQEWLNLLSGLEAIDDTVIVTTACRSVYAIRREN